AIEPTSSALNERQRRTSRAAADIEDVAGFPYSNEFSNLSLLDCSAPTLLPNIFAKDFTPQLSSDVAPEGSVLDGVKVGALFVVIGHCTLLQTTASRVGGKPQRGTPKSVGDAVGHLQRTQRVRLYSCTIEVSIGGYPVCYTSSQRAISALYLR